MYFVTSKPVDEFKNEIGNALRFIKPGEGDRMFVTLMPCSDCLKNAASYGINKVFYNKVYNFDTSAKDLAQEFRITLQQIT